MTSVQYPLAKLDGSLVWAADLAQTTNRPESATCVGCGAPVRLRAGQRNRPHFAHINDAACPGGETALHRAAIEVLRGGIVKAATAGRPFPVACWCQRCLASRDANLARAGCTLAVDQVLEDGIRPDLLVRTTSGTPIAVIEVVVTHPPEDATLELYERLKLPLVTVWPTWTSLELMRRGMGVELTRSDGLPTGCFAVTGPCRFPRHRQPGTVPCASCRQPARQLSVETAQAACWKCHKTVRLLDIIDCTDDEPVLIAAGCPDLVGVKQVAANRKINMAVRHSKQAGGSYLAHACTSSNVIQGDNFTCQADQATTDVSADAWAVTACPSGHLERLDTIPWPAGSAAQRPRRAVGHVGEPAGLFGRSGASTRSPGVQITHVTACNARQVINRMFGGMNPLRGPPGRPDEAPRTRPSVIVERRPPNALGHVRTRR